MSYKLRLRKTEEKPKWITAALVCIYVLIATIVFLNV